MPIAGKGMLLTSMDIPLEHEADFNRWYDREHLAERVAIDGFVEARRYVAIEGSPKYLSLYSTVTFGVLDSETYRAALANQTPWSKANIARFQNMIRAVGHITISTGQGRGAVLGIVRLRPDPAKSSILRASLAAQSNPSSHDGVISMHLIESDSALSRSLTNPSGTEGAGDWFVLIDGTSYDAIARLRNDLVVNDTPIISSGIYRLLFDIAAGEL